MKRAAVWISFIILGFGGLTASLHGSIFSLFRLKIAPDREWLMTYLKSNHTSWSVLGNETGINEDGARNSFLAPNSVSFLIEKVWEWVLALFRWQTAGSVAGRMDTAAAESLVWMGFGVSCSVTLAASQSAVDKRCCWSRWWSSLCMTANLSAAIMCCT